MSQVMCAWRRVYAGEKDVPIGCLVFRSNAAFVL